MASYMQMGHDTENLVGEKDLEEYKGIILSPVNRYPLEMKENVINFRKKGDFEILLDPQLYFPRSEREKLNEYPYFPSDIETADTCSPEWWDRINKNLIDFFLEIKGDTLCVPVICPKIFNDDYYSVCTEVGQKVVDAFNGTQKNILQTLVVNLEQLVNESFVMKCSSIVSQNDCAGYYLVFVSETEPRRELHDASELFGALNLINLLKNTGKPVTIAYSSTDMILFKTAGAANCATGKFFNLRRFTKSRFDEPSEGGGGQLPYRFEHSLLAFLREADILRLRTENLGNLIGNLASNNVWAQEIDKFLKGNPGKAWLRLAWRQYLSWFAKTEILLSNTDTYGSVREWLKLAEKNWIMLEDEDIFMEERRNDGNWLRHWRQALSKFNKAENNKSH